jgi:hypothetical protein
MTSRWYKFLTSSDQGVALFDHHFIADGEIVVCHQTEYRTFAKFGSIFELEKFVYNAKYTHQCFYEVIMGDKAHKWYADVDITISEDKTNIWLSFLPELNSLSDLIIYSAAINWLRTKNEAVLQVLNSAKEPELGLIARELIQHSDADELIASLQQLLASFSAPIPLAAVQSLRRIGVTAADMNIILGEISDKFYSRAEDTPTVVLVIKKALLTLFPCLKDSDILVACSNDAVKHSYHIVVDNWCVMNNKAARSIYTKLIQLLPCHLRGALDGSMYKSLQQFRFYGSHKFDSHRVKQICGPELCSWSPKATPLNARHLELFRFMGFALTQISGCEYLPSFQEEEDIAKKKYDSLTQILSRDDVSRALEIFRAEFKDNSAFAYLRYSECFISLRRLRPSYCTACRRIHDTENPYIVILGEHRDMYFDCRRAGPDAPKIKIGALGYSNIFPNEVSEKNVSDDEEKLSEDVSYIDEDSAEDDGQQSVITTPAVTGIDIIYANQQLGSAFRQSKHSSYVESQRYKRDMKVKPQQNIGVSSWISPPLGEETGVTAKPLSSMMCSVLNRYSTLPKVVPIFLK